MFKLLPTVLETCESWESPSEEKIVNSKKSTITTADTSTVSILQSQKELDLKISFLRNKVKNIQMKNTKILRTEENLKKKQEDLNFLRKEVQEFKIEKQTKKNEEFLELEIRKRLFKAMKNNRKVKIAQEKEKVLKKKKENQALVLKERMENEKFIERREKFYLQQFKGRSLESVRQERGKSFNNSSRDLKIQENLLLQMKTQQVLIEKLENALKAEETLKAHLKKRTQKDNPA
jgi:hypothetical protein